MMATAESIMAAERIRAIGLRPLVRPRRRHEVFVVGGVGIGPRLVRFLALDEVVGDTRAEVRRHAAPTTGRPHQLPENPIARNPSLT
jgi:hypothetical protein